MKRLELRIEDGALAGKCFAVPPEGLRLGRSSSNDIPLHDEALSRNHCLFEHSGEWGVRVTDLVSANGTFVNGCRLGSDSRELSVGDVIRVGGSHMTVVGEDKRVDLGLGGSQSAVPAAGPSQPRPRRSPLANVLWGVVICALGTAVWLALRPPAAQPVNTAPIGTPRPRLVEMRYEKVTADSESVFRHAMALQADGVFRVTIDDLSGEGRHVDRQTPLKDRARERLMEILSDEDFALLDGEYVGAEGEPPKLNSLRLRFFTDVSGKGVDIVNAQEPDAFRRVREKLEAFAMNELGIRALQYSREELLKLSHAAAATGRMRWEDRDIEYGNLFASIRAYREAISFLETVEPKPDEFREYVEALDAATKELDSRYDNQRFAAEQATSVGDWEKARNELRTLCEMIPDREDDRYREASVKLLDVEKRMNRKGGAK